MKGKIKLCVSEILPNYKINSQTIDTCYVFKKNYYDAVELDSISEKLYLDVKNLMIIKTETFDKNGNLINKKEIQ